MKTWLKYILGFILIVIAIGVISAILSLPAGATEIPEKPGLQGTSSSEIELMCEIQKVNIHETVTTQDWVLVDNVWVEDIPVTVENLYHRDATPEECPRVVIDDREGFVDVKNRPKIPTPEEPSPPAKDDAFEVPMTALPETL